MMVTLLDCCILLATVQGLATCRPVLSGDVGIVFRLTLLRYVRLMARAVRLSSVCLTSVCNVVAPYRVEHYGNIFALSDSLWTWADAAEYLDDGTR